MKGMAERITAEELAEMRGWAQECVRYWSTTVPGANPQHVKVLRLLDAYEKQQRENERLKERGQDLRDVLATLVGYLEREGYRAGNDYLDMALEALEGK
jgi:hypothetical protein